MPLLLGFMSAAQLGALGAVEALVVVLCGLTQLGVKFAYLQHVADVGEARRGAGFWSATWLTGLAGLAAGCLAAPLLDAHRVAGILGMPAGVRPATLGALLLLTNLQMMLVTDLRARRSPLPYVASSALRLALMLAMVAWLGPGAAAPIDAVLQAQALALAASSALLGAVGRVPGRPMFEWTLARRFLGYGWPIAAGNLVKYGTDALLPWLCLAYVSPLAAGAMALALKASALFDTLFGLPFLMAWGGRAYVIAADPAARDIVPRLFGGIVAASAAAVLAAWLSGLFVLRMAEADADAALLQAALVLLPPAVLGRALFTLRFPASVGFLAARDMRWNLWLALAGGVFFVALGPLGFSLGGAIGGWSVFLAGELGALIYIYLKGGRLLAVK